MEFSFLTKTSLWAPLSKRGKEIYTPKGIFYWSARAKTEAKIDGTIGIAQNDDGTLSHLSVAEDWVSPNVLKRVPGGKVFGYAPIEGLPTLRDKWLDFILQKHPTLEAHASLPVVTNGITHSLAIAGHLLLDAGHVLITADKSWENYEHIYTDVQGVKIVTFSLFTGDGYFHIDSIVGTCREIAQQQKKVVLLLNFPHNQTGFMPTAEDCLTLGKRLHKLCEEMPAVSFVIVLDDAYEGYVYDEQGQKSSLLSHMFAPLPNLSIAKLDGISKVMLAYGYRIAFLTFFLNSLDGAPFTPEFLKGMRSEVGTKIGGFIRGEISQANHHGQILADALMEQTELVAEQRAGVIDMLTRRWKVMMAALEAGYKKYGREKMWADPCNGGFFGYLNLSKKLDATIIAERLLKEKAVGVVPSGQGIRVAFAGVPESKVAPMIEAIFEVVYV